MSIIHDLNSIIGNKISVSELVKLEKKARKSRFTILADNIRNLINKNPAETHFIITDIDDSNTLDDHALHGIELTTEIELDNDNLSGTKSTENIYQEITNMVIKTIEKNPGKLIWEKPWNGAHTYGRMMNYASKKPYRGVNAMLLEVIYPIYYNKNWKNPFFLSATQIKERKGKVKPNARSYPIVFYTIGYRYHDNNIDIVSYKKSEFISKITAVKHQISAFIDSPKLTLDLFAEMHRFSMLKRYRVYNGEDIEGIDFKLSEVKIKNPFSPIETAEIILDHMPKKPRITTGGDSAFYSPGKDFVNMPVRESFIREPEYYATLFHELTHATAHPSRVGRTMKGKFGSLEYAFEELIAELGAAFITAEAGILNHHIKNTAAYIEGWNKRLLSRMKDDKTFIFRASGAAQKAADFILDVTKIGVPKYRVNLIVAGPKTKKKISSARLKDKKNKPTIKPGKNTTTAIKKTGAILHPNKKISASIASAIKDLLSLPKYKDYSEMAMQMLYSAYKNVDSAQIENSGLRAKVFQNQLEEKYGWVEYDDDLYQITEAGREIVDAIDGRLKTLKAKKGGQDLFPELAGITDENDTAWFPKYSQFKNKPKEAIKHLIKVKKGDCLNALYRDDIGFIDIVWGKNDKKNKGFGLKHIIEKHAKEISEFGMKVEDFIPLVVQNGVFKKSDKPGRIELSGKMFRIIISKKETKTFVLSAFDLRPITKKIKGLSGVYDGIDFIALKSKETDRSTLVDHFTPEPLLPRTNAFSKSNKKLNIFQRPGEVVQKKDVFRLPGSVGEFLQDLQKYRMAILLKGDPHSGKTQFAWQLVDAFIEGGFKPAVFDLEQGGLVSKDTQLSIERNVHPSRQKQLLVAGEAPNGIDTIREVANDFDVIMIDSWQKLKIPNSRLDDLRNEFPDTIFILIFQQNSEGGTRGGVTADYDTPIAIKVHKVDSSFVNNYAELQKNRGNKIGTKFNVASRSIMPEQIE